MNPIITPEILEVMKAVHYRPAVSIIMPFETKINSKTELSYSLKIATDKVEKELEQSYPAEISLLVMQKLRRLISNLKVDVHKKSVAIYVSPVFEKVLFLDITVEEKIIIDESFEIRDLIYCKKQLHKFLVLLISGKECRMYMGNANHFIRIVTGLPDSIDAYKKDTPERVANFSDSAEQKEIVIDQFLHHIDKALDTILKTFHLPLFVLGAERILGHFKKMTKHSSAVSKYIQGNYEEATFPELNQLLAPHIIDWKKERQNELLKKLEVANGKMQLATGIKDVWREAMNQKGRLLLVEKNYMVAARHGSQEAVIYKEETSGNTSLYIKDAVDDVIEKVLENGGDVEFVEEGLLNDYQQIALIQYYQ